jgi:carbon-monoxide dehydrogenase medium subunit
LKPPPFDYFAPTTIEEALGLFSESGDARFLAGGQSLMPMLNMRVAAPDRVIDLNGIESLAGVTEQDGDIIIGAMTRQRRLARDPVVRGKLPLFPMALRHVGHLQTRNRGTIGGSLCHLDPSAELPAIAFAYDAVLETAGPAGRRHIPVAAWPSSFMETCLADGEMLTSIRLTPWGARAGYGFHEFARRHGDFAIAGAAALLDFDDMGRISRASLTLFGVHSAPVRVAEAEAILTGAKPGEALFAKAAAASRAFATLSDPYCSAAYRGEVATAMAERALAQAAGLAGEAKR